MSQANSPKRTLGSNVVYSIGLLFIAAFIVNFLNIGRATLTIVCDEPLPIEFVLQDDSGPPWPLIVDAKIEVKNGFGKFISGSYEEMNYYGFSTYFPRCSRKVEVELVDRRGKILSRHESVTFGFIDDDKARHGQRFFVRNSL